MPSSAVAQSPSGVVSQLNITSGARPVIVGDETTRTLAPNESRYAFMSRNNAAMGLPLSSAGSNIGSCVAPR